MKCSQIQDLLPDYSVELLDGRTHAAVQQHLAVCVECQAELRLQDTVMSLVETYGAAEPPVGLFNGVRNRIESGEVVREKPAWWAWFNTRPARGLAMGLAMAAVVVGLAFPVGGPATNAELAIERLPLHQGPTVTNTALASSIRQHAMSSVEGPLADRVAWEAMAQLVSQDREGVPGRTNGSRPE